MAACAPQPPLAIVQFQNNRYTSKVSSDFIWRPVTTSNLLTFEKYDLEIERFNAIASEAKESIKTIYKKVGNILLANKITNFRFEIIEHTNIAFVFKKNEFTFDFDVFSYDFEDNINTVYSWYQNDLKLPSVSGKFETVLMELDRFLKNPNDNFFI